MSDWPSWKCPHCDFPPSYNPNDVEHHYCGNCGHFCDDVARHETMRKEQDELFALLGNARYVLWFCPHDADQQHREHREGNKLIVEWTDDEAGMTPRCLVCGEVGATR
jgi:hypothetical protein